MHLSHTLANWTDQHQLKITGEKVLVSGLSTKRQQRNFLQESKSRSTVKEFREVPGAQNNCSASLSACSSFQTKELNSDVKCYCVLDAES